MVRNIIVAKYNLVYIDCSDLIVNVYISILKQFTELDKLKDRDLKKLIFHYVVTALISRNKHSSKRPVYFFNKIFLLEFTDKRYIKCFLSIIKHLKNLLPVPLIILENHNIFDNDNGELKGLNEKISNHYITNKSNTKKLRKYLQNEEFYELIKVLGNIKNIKQLST